MSLDFDCSDCVDPIPANDEEAVMRRCLVFETMAVCLNSITEENEAEWVFRVMLLQNVDMSTIVFDDSTMQEKRDHLLAALRRWRGMTTNASAQPRKKWLAATMDILAKDVERRYLPVEAV